MSLRRLVRVGCYYDDSLSNADYCNIGKIAMKDRIPRPGVEIEILLAIAKLLKWDLQFIAYPGQTNYGYKDANGTWGGLVKALQDEEIDITGSTLSINEERQEAITYSYPVAYVNQIMFISNETLQMDETRVGFVLKPFQYDMWAALLTSLLVVALFHWLYVYLLKPERKEILPMSVWELFSIAMRQNYREYGIKARAMLGMQWVFFCLLVTTYYQSVQNSLLAVQLGEKIPFSSLETLLDVLEGGNNQGWQVIDYTKQPIVQCPTPEICARWNKVQVNAVGRTPQAGQALQKLLDFEHGVFFGNIEQVLLPSQTSVFRYSSIRQKISPLIVLRDDTIQSTRTAYAFRKDSPLVAEFNRALIEVQPGLDRIVQRYKIAHPEFANKPSARPQPLGLWKLQEAYWMLVAGLLLGIALVLIECAGTTFWHKYMLKAAAQPRDNGIEEQD